MNLFEQIYFKIINEDFNSFQDLDSSQYPKAIKYHNFPEDQDIDITQNFKNNYLQNYIQIILLKHCIKSEDIDNIHGINYMNIPINRFFQILAKCFHHILNNEQKYEIQFKQQDIRFNIKDTKLNQEYSIIIENHPIANSFNYTAKIKTIFYNKHSNKEGLFKKHSDKGYLKYCPVFSCIFESKFKILAFDLTV